MGDSDPLRPRFVGFHFGRSQQVLASQSMCSALPLATSRRPSEPSNRIKSASRSVVFASRKRACQRHFRCAPGVVECVEMQRASADDSWCGSSSTFGGGRRASASGTRISCPTSGSRVLIGHAFLARRLCAETRAIAKRFGDRNSVGGAFSLNAEQPCEAVCPSEALHSRIRCPRRKRQRSPF